MRRAGLLWVVFAVITVGGCSDTQGTNPGSSEQPAGRPAAVGTGGAGAALSDDEFVRDVALKHLAVVQLSRLALEKATNSDVRTFARNVIDYHGESEQKLKSAVSEQRVEWPIPSDDKHRKTAEELAEKQGTAFDRDYVKTMIERHQDLAAKLESRLDVQSLAEWKTAVAARTESKALPDPATTLRDLQVRPNKSDNAVTMMINQWAADTYPGAQKHLDTARALEAVTKKTSSS